jgi:hypothetical protein
MAIRYLILGIFLSACNGPRALVQSGAPLSEAPHNHLYAVVSDFTSGGVQRADLREGKWDAVVLPAHADALARWDSFSQQLLVVNRLAGNHLTISSPEFKVMRQIGFTENSNPQDVLPLDNGDVYVSSMHDTHLRRWNLASGLQVGEGIDLTEWKDADGFAEASYMVASGGRVAVALEQLDIGTYLPGGPGTLLVIDPATNLPDKAKTRPLARKNPFTEFKKWDGKLYLGEAGVLNRKKPVLDGGIECIDPVTFASKGIIVEEAKLGGDILDFEILTDKLGVAIISTPSTDVMLFDPSTGEKVTPPGGRPGEALLSGGGFRYTHVLVDRARALFYLADRDSEHPAVRVFGFDGGEKSGNRLPLELPPFKLVLAP